MNPAEAELLVWLGALNEERRSVLNLPPLSREALAALLGSDASPLQVIEYVQGQLRFVRGLDRCRPFSG